MSHDDEDIESIELPLEGTLDLHTFSPAEVKELIPEYLAACRGRGLLQLRIVHGKGTGVLRQIVHTELAKSPLVAAYRLADGSAGGWGATLVELRPESPGSTGGRQESR